MKIIVIGAHGKVGRLAIPVLVDHGQQVSGVVRAESQVPLVAELGGTPVLFDVEHASTEEIAEALAGFDAVVWSAGAGGGSPDRTYAVDRDAAIRSMEAAASAGVQRYVMVSWIGSVPDHGVPEDSSFFAYADAKLAADDHLRGTDLDWTILGPGTLTTEPGSGTITVLGEGERPEGASSDTSRANVALVIDETLREDATIGTFVQFTDGETPIAEALRGA